MGEKQAGSRDDSVVGVRGRHKSRGKSLVSGLCMGLKAEIRTPGKGKMMVARVFVSYRDGPGP